MIDRRTISIALVALMTGFSSAQGQGDAILADAIKFPGSYAQVCDVMTTSPDVPFWALQLHDLQGSALSEEKKCALLMNRDQVIAALKKQLKAIDFSKKPQVIPQDPNGEGEEISSGSDPKTFSSHLLRVIEHLDAVEVLPELLEVEAELVKRINLCKEDPKIAPPYVDGWFIGIISEEGSIDEKTKPELQMARVAQRDVLMLMHIMLRNKHFGPMLQCDFEKQLRQLMLKNQEKHKLRAALTKAKTLERLIENPDLTYTPEIDAVSGIVHAPEYEEYSIAYSRPLRDGIRAAAQKWIDVKP